MVIRNEFTTINDGDQLNEGYFNDLIQSLWKYKDSSNTTHSTTGTTYTTAKTLTFAAGEVTKDFYVRFNLRAHTPMARSEVSAQTTTPYAQITVDGTQDTEVVGPGAIARGGSNVSNVVGDTSASTGVYFVKVSPTPTQKSNGFTVDLDLKGTYGAYGGTVFNDYWEVWYQ